MFLFTVIQQTPQIYTHSYGFPSFSSGWIWPHHEINRCIYTNFTLVWTDLLHVCVLPLSDVPGVRLCPLFLFFKESSLAWESSLTKEDRWSLSWIGGEALRDSPSPLSLPWTVDLLCRKWQSDLHFWNSWSIIILLLSIGGGGSTS